MVFVSLFFLKIFCQSFRSSSVSMKFEGKEKERRKRKKKNRLGKVANFWV